MKSDGFSLLEALISIAILAALMSVFAVSRPAPSQKVKVDQVLAEVAANVTAGRLKAVRQRQVIELSVSATSCNGDTQTITLFPNGSSRTAPLCFLVDGEQVHAALDPFTSALVQTSDP